MRSLFAAALTIAASTAFFGCAANIDHAPDSEETDEAGNAITTIATELVGAYEVKGGSATFQHMVLKDDGTYFTDQDVTCVRYPCPDVRENGTWRATDFSKKTTGSLTLKPTGHAARRYSITLGATGGIHMVRSNFDAKLEKSLNFCDDSSDCEGQSVRALGLMCMKGQSYHKVCATDSHSCIAKCISDVPCQVSGCGVVCGETVQVCNKMLKAGVAACYADVGKCGRTVDGTCAWLDQERVDACLDRL
jgi:hypothetical protein